MHILESQLPDILYTFWDDLPIILDASAKSLEKLSSKKTQNYIINSLSVGIDDQYPGGLKKRHALSASEIQEIIDKRYDSEVKKSNIYYHLQKLVELEIIKVVSTVQRANIVTSYYGRTSKLIFTDMKETDKKKNKSNKKDKKHLHPVLKLLESPQFFEFLQSYNPSESVLEEIQTLSNRVIENGFEHNSEFKDWIISNEEKFRGLDFDLLGFNSLFNQMKSFNEDFARLYSKLNEVLNIL